jgi:rhodanese-related sulfurtransferase
LKEDGMPPLRIDVPQAHAALQEDPKAVYLDVRSEQEFAEGHPEGAINIPIGTPNPVQQRLEPNPDFLAVARAVIPAEIPVIVGCKAGPRAELAARVLAEHGYADVRWVLGGFHGMTDPMGNVVAPGWSQLELPSSRETGEGVGYGSLRRKAGLK